jgi:soluble lytic murein transglycosylase-like protein
MDRNSKSITKQAHHALIVSVCAGLWGLSQPVYSDTVSYKHRAADGTVTFSDAPVVNGVVTRLSYGSTKRSVTVVNPCRGLSQAQLDARGKKLDSVIAVAAEKYSLDPALIKAVARAESCFDPLAVSRVGAKGLMQLMPPTARELGVRSIFDTQENMMGGAKYLAQMLKRYSNDTNLALAAYNAGSGNVDQYDGIPPFAETKRYIKQVTKHRARYSTPLAAPTISAQSDV